MTRSRRVHSHVCPSQPEYLRAHQLGNSLSVLRQCYALGVRYMTLTHACHNAFADSGGILTPLPPLHHGLSDFGVELIKEMNRYEFVSLFKGVFILTELLRLGMPVDSPTLRTTPRENAQRHTSTCHLVPLVRSHSTRRSA